MCRQQSAMIRCGPTADAAFTVACRSAAAGLRVDTAAREVTLFKEMIARFEGQPETSGGRA
jgi:hypothetical protein